MQRNADGVLAFDGVVIAKAKVAPDDFPEFEDVDLVFEQISGC